MTTVVVTSPAITPIDPYDPRTWKNHPCPVDLRPIQDELTRVGGLNRYNDPNFIIVWAQEYKTFDCGRMRIHFDEDVIPAIHKPVRFGVSQDAFQRAVAWLDEQNAKRKEAFMNLDFEGLQEFPDVADYLKNNELKDNWMKLPDDETDTKRLASLMPDSWMYLNGLHEFEHIGQQAFYVLQYMPPEAFGDPRLWNTDRIGKAYVPELDAEAEFVDIIGPFPAKGMYDHVVIRVADTETVTLKSETIVGATQDVEILRFKTPTRANTVEPLKEMLRIRETLSDYQKSSAYRTERKRKEFEDGAPARAERFAKQMSEKIRDAAPVGLGNPTNISANKAKAH